MSLRGAQIAFALPEGHFSMPQIISEIEKMLAAGADVFPLFLATSENVESDAQFHATRNLLEQITGREMMTASLADETSDLFNFDTAYDMLVIAPCPGNFLSRLVNARAMAAPLAKTVRHLQTGCPVVLALVANGDSENLLLNVQQILSIKSIFLVPFGPVGKGEKQIFLARLDLLYETVLQALAQRQLQPVFIEPCWLPH
jgi:dipicolinate synthase subunit B